MPRKGKIRWGAVVAAATTVAGVVAGPLGAAVVGTKASAIVALGGAIVQMFAKPVARAEHERVAP